MNIGGALAEARSEAGLTITQVSERTRIRETIIRSIELDDYSPCGGDYYARGHIRAIARAVGADPVPLIEEYDAARLPPPEPESVAPGTEGGDGTDVITAPPDTPWQAARRWVKQTGQPDDRPAYSPPGITAAEAFRPGLPIDFASLRSLSAGTKSIERSLSGFIGASGASVPGVCRRKPLRRAGSGPGGERSRCRRSGGTCFRELP